MSEFSTSSKRERAEAAARKGTETNRMKYTNARRAWVTVGGNMVAVYMYDNENVELAFKGAKSSLFKFNLTKYTLEELAAIATVFEMALANAAPTVEKRDQEAQDEFDQGIDTDPRLYRAVPQVLVREGEKFTDRPKLLRGYEWARGVSVHIAGASGAITRRIRGSSVPEQGEAGHEPGDDEA